MRPTPLPRRAVFLVVAALAIAAVGCQGSDEPGASAPVATPPSTPADLGPGDTVPAVRPDEDPGLTHVHGLGVNPGDGSLYVATHFGLWRVEGGDAERVGEAFHDLMGFTVVGEDHFVASGHPLLVDDAVPPLLGLIASTDAGRTWQVVSLLGEADFHALRAAHGRIYGWNSSEATLLVSVDDGETWERRSPVEGLVDLAVDPEDPDHLVATVAPSGAELAAVESRDGGGTWEPMSAPPLVLRLAWEQPGRLWAVGANGAVWRATGSDGDWQRTGEVGGAPEALFDDGERLWVSVEGAISESPDGATWTERVADHRP